MLAGDDERQPPIVEGTPPDAVDITQAGSQDSSHARVKQLSAVKQAQMRPSASEDVRRDVIGGVRVEGKRRREPEQAREQSHHIRAEFG